MDAILDVEDRQKTLDVLHEQIEAAESGLRAVCIMYDEHSSDKQSYENIFRLRDNIYYRLCSARHQFKLLFLEHYNAEKYLVSIAKSNPEQLNGFLFRNPHIERIDTEISSVFDGIIYHLSSIFDYLGHIVCYVCKNDKLDTLHWTKLARAARGRATTFVN